MKKRTMTCLIVAAIFFISAAVASARPFRLGKLPDNGAKFGCGTCHVNPGGGGPRNAFGQDYEKLGLKGGDKYTKELGGMDSDKDGISNDQEFSSGTHPGDASSKPTS
jgi:hypothetical protein